MIDMNKVYEYVFYLIPFILMLHYCLLVCSDDSRHQKRKLRNSLTHINSYLVKLNLDSNDGIRFHELKVIYKNRESKIGVHKKEHNYYYITYDIFINGDEAGVLHQIGDSLWSQYYFEQQNHREKSEVMAIVNAGAKEVKRLAKSTTEKKSSWNEYSYFK